MEPDVKKLMGDWSSTEWKKFENLWDRCFSKQFNQKYKASAKCYKKNVQISDYILGGAGKKTKLFEFDGLVVLTDDHKPIMAKTGNRTPLIVNFEYTIKKGKALDYWTLETKASDGKLIKLMKFMNTNGNPAERKERLKRLGSKYSSAFPNEEDFDTAYLIGIDRFREINLSDNVTEIQNNVDKEFGAGSAKVSAISNTGAITVEMDGFTIIAGILNLGQCADHMATVHSLSKHLNTTNDMKRLFFERGLFEVTEKLAGREYSLLSNDPLPSIPVTVLSSEAPDSVSNLHSSKVSPMHGHNVETYRLRIRLVDLLRLCTVERTLNDVGRLQRLPVSRHLKMIAMEGINEGREFVNPVVISTTHDFKVERDPTTKADYLKPTSMSKNMEHYSWALIDGQHRIFSGYLVDLSTPKLANVEFDAVIRYLNPNKIPSESMDDINAQTFFDLNYRSLPPKADIALVRSTEISAWPNGWIPYQTRLVIYSSRIHAARFLLELNKKGPLKDRFGLGGEKFGATQIGLSSASTYLGDTYNHFDFFFQYKNGGTPNHHKHSIGPLYASWNVKSSSGRLVYPDNKEWMASQPAYEAISQPNGLEDNVKIGKTCKQLEDRGFWENIAKDFNQFLKQIMDNFDPLKHKFKVGGKDIDWTDSMNCLYISKNSGGLPALFGAWFAYVKKHRPPSRSGAKHAVSKNYDPKIGKALAKFFEDKIHAKNPGIPGASNTHGLFKNSDGNDCKHNYSSALGMKLFRSDLIAVINDAMKWKGTSDEIEF